MVDAAEASVGKQNSIYGFLSKHGLCDWHKASNLELFN